MAQKFFVIGGGVLQKNFVERLNERGFETHVFDYDKECICAKIASVFHCISITAKEAILDIAIDLKPIGVQTVATELGNITACYVGEKMGLNNNSFQVGLNTTDKSLMKEIFIKNNIRNAKHIKVKTWKALEKHKIDFPIVVKPADRSAGRGVTLVTDKASLKIAFDLAHSESNNKIILLEEVLIGNQYSVETISSNGTHQIITITEEHLDGSINFVETQQVVPARVSKETEQKIHNFIIKVLNAFNIKFGACHIEVKVNGGVISIIEIASRMGGWRDRLIELAFGLNYLDLIIDATLGREIVIKKKFEKYAIVKMLMNTRDYQEYLKLKTTTDFVKFDEFNSFDEGKDVMSLMDSQGFYYLQVDDANVIDKFLFYE